MISINAARSKLKENCKIIDSGCWQWQMSLTKYGGYGRVYFDGKVHRAHRLSFQAFKGEIPEGYVIMHTCDNPKCINPDHLIAATQQENLNDCRKKGRDRKACGIKAGSAKLTEEQVVFIFLSTEKHRVLAEMFSISESQISFIKNKKTWTSVTSAI